MNVSFASSWTRCLSALFVALVIFSSLPAASSVLASSVVASAAVAPMGDDVQAATSAPVAQASGDVVLLRDLLGRSAMDGVANFLVGGGFLYWASCTGGGPAAAEMSVAPAGTGAVSEPEAATALWLRRVPLGGGAIATVPDMPCVRESWAADDAGLFYWYGDALWRRDVASPFVAQKITTTGKPGGRVAVDDTWLYWIVGNALWRVPKMQIYNPDDIRFDQSEFVADTSSAARSLLIAGNTVYWLDSVGLRSVSRNCSEVCTVQTLASGNGTYLSDASVTLKDGGYAFPLWSAGATPGNQLVGRTCVPFPGGPQCLATPTTYYTAPNRASEGGVLRNAYLGAADDDGAFLFWIENLRGDTPDEVRYDGRLMKWKLDQSNTGDTSPFVTPRAIAQYTGTFLLPGADDDHVQVAGGNVYFMTTAGLARIGADAPPLRWDVAFRYMETNQVVQNVLNEAPLVAGKPAVVRVYPNKTEGPNLYNVDARLLGWNESGAPLPGSPLRPINGSLDLLANNAPVDRATLDGSWLFNLPGAWVAEGTIKLRAEIDPRGLVNDPNRANNKSADDPFIFFAKNPVCLVAIPVRTHGAPANTNDSSFMIQAEVLRQLYPTDDVWIATQSNDVAQIQARLGVPPWKYVPYALPGDGEHVIQALRERALFSDDPDSCESAGATIHYVGLLSSSTPTPNPDGSEQLGLGCRPPDSCDLGFLVSYVKLVGKSEVAQASRQSPLLVSSRFATLAHEVGHNLGRRHIACNGIEANPDPDWPYKDYPCRFSNSYAGFDVSWMRPIMPVDSAGTAVSQVADIMAYSQRVWMGDYTYRALFDTLPSVQAASPEAAAAQAEMLDAGAVLYVSGSVAPGQPQGSLDYLWNYPTAAISQRVLEKLAAIAATAFATPSVQDASLAADAWHVVLLNAQGATLTDHTVTPSQSEDGDTPSQLDFTLTIPAVAGVARIELRNGVVTVASRNVSAHAPSLSIVAPAGGETFDQSMTLTWDSTDADGDPLLFTFQYSYDQGQHWQTFLASYPKMAEDMRLSLPLADISEFPASTTGGMIRIVVSDGYNTTMATSNAFTVPNRKPVVTILFPSSGSVFQPNESITFDGTANDVEDGGLDGDALVWKLNGTAIGTGQSVTVDSLIPGDYTVSLTASDSKGTEATSSVNFTVAPLAIPILATSPKMDGNCNEPAYITGQQVLLYPYGNGTQTPVSLVGDANGLWICLAGMPRTTGSSPGTVVKMRFDTNFSREAGLGANDLVYYLNEAAFATSFVYNGSAFVAGPGGALGQVTATTDTWNAELFIDKDVLGGWGHVVGLGVEQAAVVSANDYYPWPHALQTGNASTWSPALLGALPELNALEPISVTSGGGAIALKVRGSGFAQDAVALWNGEARPTTVISATQVNVQLSAADLAAAGVAHVQVRNFGAQEATSGDLPFLVENGTPAISSASIENGVLLVQGSGFVTGAQIVYNGFALTPSALTSNQATAQPPAPALQTTDKPAVTVVNPEPGGGASNVYIIGGENQPPSGTVQVHLPLITR